ncbi:ATP-binding protein [Streptomyces chrestomyceticus]|uniref:ATP-binding protein n=1 Tax=Streptomyces chrestomyceticus TaxID=68185 RepID=UPI00378AEE53
MTSMTAAQPRRTGHPGYTLIKPRDPEAAADARRLVRVALAVWGLDAETDAAALLLTELVTNALRHATRGRSIRIIVSRPSDTQVRLAVVDRDPRRVPAMRAAGPADADGRGLLLVGQLADRWGYDLMGPALRPWGKQVWAELTVGGSGDRG